MVWMTIKELCEELGIARSSFDNWRLRGNAPRMTRLPNGEYRIRRADVEAWLDGLVVS